MGQTVLPMSCLRRGQRAMVSEVTLAGDMRRRLRELGLLPGAMISCLYVAPAGTPVAYDICGAAVALRSADAEGVQVCLC